MLTLWRPMEHHAFCDGHSRRSFLKIGSLGLGGLSLPSLLQTQAKASSSAAQQSHKSVIMVYLSGGLAHQDTFDLKPDAPEGIRGEFRPIPTRVPGVQISELLPKIAGVLDKVALIRSIVNLRDEHSSFQNLTGFPMAQSQREGRPSLGSVIGAYRGLLTRLSHRLLTYFPRCSTVRTTARALAFWGTPINQHVWMAMTWCVLQRPENISLQRFDRRCALLHQFDQFRRQIDNADLSGMNDSYHHAARCVNV